MAAPGAPGGAPPAYSFAAKQAPVEWRVVSDDFSLILVGERKIENVGRRQRLGLGRARGVRSRTLRPSSLTL